MQKPEQYSWLYSILSDIQLKNAILILCYFPQPKCNNLFTNCSPKVNIFVFMKAKRITFMVASKLDLLVNVQNPQMQNGLFVFNLWNLKSQENVRALKHSVALTAVRELCLSLIVQF